MSGEEKSDGVKSRETNRKVKRRLEEQQKQRKQRTRGHDADVHTQDEQMNQREQERGGEGRRADDGA